jgi:hypothetical protein
VRLAERHRQLSPAEHQQKTTRLAGCTTLEVISEASSVGTFRVQARRDSFPVSQKPRAGCGLTYLLRSH